MSLATLADEIVLAGAIGLNFGEDIYCLSVDCAWSWDTLTPADTGPLVVGWAHGDLTVGEILEAITAELTDPDDIIARERSRRPVRTVGQLRSDGVATQVILPRSGEMSRTKLKFSIGDGHILNFWVMAHDPAGLTGGSLLRVHGVLYGRWQR